MAAGAGDAGAGILSAGQTAAMGKFLAFTRVQEAPADATGARFLPTAGIGGKGMLAFFKQIPSQECPYGYTEVDPFAQYHPLRRPRGGTREPTLPSTTAWAAPTAPPTADAAERAR